MPTLTDADLDSTLVDLTTVPLAELRTFSSSALAAALAQAYEAAEVNTGNEVQDQNAVS